MLYCYMHRASIAVGYCIVSGSGMREATPSDFYTERIDATKPIRSQLARHLRKVWAKIEVRHGPITASGGEGLIWHQPEEAQ